MKFKGMAFVAAVVMCAAPALSRDLVFPPGVDDRFDWEGYESFSRTDLSDEVLTISGPWTGPDKVLVENVLAYFEAATGARVSYAGSDSFEQDIVIAARAGSAPNIAVFPQPGLAADMARRGYLAPLGEETADWVRANYAAGESWVRLGSYADRDGDTALFGFFYKVELKSLVWYVPDNFTEAGYDVPRSMEELKALTEMIAADGATPWCIGLGSGAATGWPATDWVEDLLLRRQPPGVYDAWVENAIPFDDARVVDAIEDYGWFVRNGAFVANGTASVATTDFRDSPKGLFTFPPKCYMHRQASFIPTFFPSGTEIGRDVDFFYFPAYAGMDLGAPVLGSGTLWTITRDSPAARALIAFLKTPIAHELWMAQAGFLTPFKAANRDAYASELQRAQGDILIGATTFRFDGSDLMPGEIGADAFWKGMVAYTTGQGAARVARDIQARWDSIR
ncbi:maltose-binding protein /trehalose-binding protein /sucrose-binding protein [Rhodovulum bhavnagarense]|uniref:Maltose-binding protein /trehalose-binding protein /sucrose-binding protein n=1 Tax=Rhodovulum bhavnagarense TaxID=992286 RepID=A0A4R2R958_9RHOB|nr:ABC transporter substrate-binding protein [Rhodovulum bhavnagarense]TCP59750.1 maltose-binding protein /trehalose-binding protein /sucrose-binding protein [Rhodovulum bhavnagarense]